MTQQDTMRLAGVEMPEPCDYQYVFENVQKEPFYTTDQLQAYAAACAAQAREEALDEAKGVCLNWSERHAIHDGCTYEDCDFVAAATDCANAIDKLKVTP